MKHAIIVAVHKVSQEAHKVEHGVHLTYFGALSTGLFDYHLIAIACLVFGLLSMLPQGEHS